MARRRGGEAGEYVSYEEARRGERREPMPRSYSPSGPARGEPAPEPEPPDPAERRMQMFHDIPGLGGIAEAAGQAAGTALGPSRQEQAGRALEARRARAPQGAQQPEPVDVYAGTEEERAPLSGERPTREPAGQEELAFNLFSRMKPGARDISITDLPDDVIANVVQETGMQPEELVDYGWDIGDLGSRQELALLSDFANRRRMEDDVRSASLQREMAAMPLGQVIEEPPPPYTMGGGQGGVPQSPIGPVQIPPGQGMGGMGGMPGMPPPPPSPLAGPVQIPPGQGAGGPPMEPTPLQVPPVAFQVPPRR